MIILVPMILSAALSVTPSASQDLSRFQDTASDWLLSGQGLPRDYRVTLMQMEVADRLRAIAYLRRIGLLTERPWSLDDLLRPAATRTETRE